MQRLTWIDYGRLLNMALALLAGGIMLYRAVVRDAPWPAYLMGGLFLLFGGHRLVLLLKKGRGTACRAPTDA